MDTTLDLDLDLWTRQTSDNPVFYVQYAHARLASLARNAADLGHRAGLEADYDPALLDTERESELIALLAAYPGVLADRRRTARAAPGRAVPGGSGVRLPQVLRLGPGAADGRRGARPPRTVARLWLCAATRQVLANGLAVLGVTAPERM